MPATALELISGPRISRKNKTAEFDYLVRGATDEADAEAAALSEADPTYGDENWPVDDIVTEPRGTEWMVRLVYAASGGGGLPETGTVIEEFDTSGETQKRDRSIATIATFPSGGPDLKGAINFSDGKIEGVDVVFPRYRTMVTKYVANADIAALKAAAYNLTGAVNDDEWRGFASGEALLVRARGRPRSPSDWEVVFEFDCRPNQTGGTYAGISGVDKEGHDYAWALYGESVDGNELIPTARYIMVERVYPRGDFDALDLE